MPLLALHAIFVPLDRSADVRQSRRQSRIFFRFLEPPPGGCIPRRGRGTGRRRSGRGRGRGPGRGRRRRSGQWPSSRDRQRIVHRYSMAATRYLQSLSTRGRGRSSCREQAAPRQKEQSSATHERESCAQRRQAAERQKEQSPSNGGREASTRASRLSQSGNISLYIPAMNAPVRENVETTATVATPAAPLSRCRRSIGIRRPWSVGGTVGSGRTGTMRGECQGQTKR